MCEWILHTSAPEHFVNAAGASRLPGVFVETSGVALIATGDTKVQVETVAMAHRFGRLKGCKSLKRGPGQVTAEVRFTCVASPNAILHRNSRPSPPVALNQGCETGRAVGASLHIDPFPIWVAAHLLAKPASLLLVSRRPPCVGSRAAAMGDMVVDEEAVPPQLSGYSEFAGNHVLTTLRSAACTLLVRSHRPYGR